MTDAAALLAGRLKELEERVAELVKLVGLKERLLGERTEELAEWEQLEALRRTREQPWIQQWQQETGKLDTLPDYGEFFKWVLDKAEIADGRRGTYGNMLRYVAFVLTGDETADVQLAADRVMAELTRLRERAVHPKTEDQGEIR